MDQAAIEKIDEQIQDMPTLPAVAAKILEVIDDPETSANDLRKVISLDSVLTARILRIVNSAFYGFPRRIDSLTNAIVILGFNNVRSLALSVSILDFFDNAEPKNARLNYDELWKHSIGVAFCARAISRRTLPDFIEQSFVAGLLHDIGLIIVDNCFHDKFTGCLMMIEAEKRPLQEIEKETFDFTHADVGQYAGEKWLLPYNLVEAIGHHHNPTKATNHFEIASIVHTADIICKCRKFGDYGDAEFTNMSQIHQFAANALRLGFPLSPDIEEELDKELERAQEFLKFFS